MNLKYLIIAKEKSLHNKKIRNSTEKLARLISSEFLEIGTAGNCHGFEEVIANLPNEDKWSCQTFNWKYRKISTNVVQVIYTAHIKSDVDPGNYSLRTSIWKREANDWKLYFHQSTKLLSKKDT